MSDDLQAYFLWREWLEMWRQLGLLVEEWSRLYVSFMRGLQ